MSEANNIEKKAAGVGYGRPPAEHRFRKGVSGNPRGRPRKRLPAQDGLGSHDVNGVILQEAYRTVSVREGDKTVDLTVIEAAVRALGLSAIKGNRLAQVAFAEMVDRAASKRVAERTEAIDHAREHIAWCKEEFARCDARGEPRPSLLPHPDDIFLNVSTGLLHIIGPKDEREKVVWDRYAQRRLEAMAELKELRSELLDKRKLSRCRGYEEAVLHDIEHDEWIVEMCDVLYPCEEIRRARGFDFLAYYARWEAYAEENERRWRELPPELKRRRLKLVSNS